MGRKYIHYEQLPDYIKMRYSEEEYNGFRDYKRYRIRKEEIDSIDLRRGIKYAKRKEMPQFLVGKMSEEEYHSLPASERRFIRKPTRYLDITILEYWDLYELQQGLCAICEQPERETRLGTIKRLSIDHDHATGKIRGLLCSICNKPLKSKNEEALQWLNKAIKYIEKAAI